MPCMEYEAVTNFYLAFKKYILGNKKIRVGAKNKYR